MLLGIAKPLYEGTEDPRADFARKVVDLDVFPMTSGDS